MSELSVVDAQSGEVLAFENVAVELRTLARTKKVCEEREKELKNMLLKGMLENNVRSLEQTVADEMVKVLLVDGFDRETFDTKTFKAENPDIYDTYVKISHVRPSVRVTVK